MKFGKRVLSLSFAVLILFTAVQTAYAEEESAANAINEEYGYKIEVLNALGITDIKVSGFSPAESVTREMFSEGIAAMMVEDASAMGIEPTGDLEAEDTGMLFLKSIGIINGTEENVFEPNSNITLEQAVKIAVSALGFAEISDYKGGYSSGYMTEAKRIGLLDGVNISPSAELCMGDYINMLYNLLGIDVLEPKSFGSANTYYRADGNTLISVYRKIRKGEGIVSANKYSGLYSEGAGTHDETVEISGEYYRTGETKAEDFLGLHTEFYYYDLKNDIEKTLLYIAPTRVNRSLLINSGDLSYDGGVYTYTDNSGGRKKIKIPVSAVIMYNDVFQSMPDKTKLVPQYGSVEFISNNGDSSYEVIKIRDITVTVVLSVSSDGTAVYDKYNTDYNIDIEGKDCSVTLANGKEGTVLNISKDDVVETVKTECDGQSYYRLKIVTDSVTDTIQRIEPESITRTDATGAVGTVSVAKELYLSDKKYTVSSRLKELILSGKIAAPTAGRSYLFHLNSRGEITDISDKPERAFRIGYFKRFAAKSEAFDTKYMIRLFDESGAWETYELAQRIKLNGVSVKANEINSLDMYIGKACKYELNVAGEVTSLYFPSETDENFRTVYSMKEPYFRRYYGSPVFGPKSEDDGVTCSIKSTSVIFIIPNFSEASVDEDLYDYQYAVIPSSKLPNYNSYGNVDIYNTEGDIGIGDVAVVKMKTHGYVLNENSTRPVLINDIISVWDGGEVKTEIAALSNGNEIRFFVEDLRTNGGDLPFGPGDVVFCFVAKDRTLRLYDDAKYYHILLDYDDTNPIFAKAFDWNAGAPIGVSYRSSMAADVRIRYGSVYKTDGEYMWLNTSADPSDTSAVEATKCTSARIYVYDKEKKQYTVGRAADIVGYTSDKVNYSRAVVVYSDSYAEIVVY